MSSSRMLVLSLSLAVVVAISATDSRAFADDKAKSEQFTFRLIGLFSKDREKDLREALAEIPEVKIVGVNFQDAELTVEFAPAGLFPDAKPAQILERFDQKLRSATRNTFSVKPRRTTARDRLQEMVIPVVGLDCKACCLAAYESIAGIDGVEQATASFKDGRVTALIDPKKIDREKLEEALRKKGVQLGK